MPSRLATWMAFRHSSAHVCDKAGVTPDQWNHCASLSIVSQSKQFSGISAKAECWRSYTILLARLTAPVSRKYNPSRSPPKFMCDTSTPCWRKNCNAACPMALSGNRVTCAAGMPKPASDSPTLASVPPKCTSNCVVCSNLRKPGGESRIMTSPKVTTFFMAMDCW